MRRSAAISVAIGTTLDDGASSRKNHAPRKANPAHLPSRIQATIVAPRSTVSTIAPGIPTGPVTGRCP
jgi:hypothetical protein